MTENEGNYAEISGLKIYYEIHGEGEPLILLHGGFGITGMLDVIVQQLATGRQVIVADLQAHGRTADIDRPLSLETMGDDVAALIEHLGLAEADVMGYSMGGGVALQTAIQHPELVRKLVVVSFPFRRDGWYPEIASSMDLMSSISAEFMKDTPMYEAYARVAPDPDHFPVLCDKMGNMMGQDYDWSTEVAALTMPTMLVYGDSDSVPPTHAAEFFRLLGGGKQDAGWDGSGMPNARLAILPGTTHYDSFASPMLTGAVTPFLDAQMSEARQ